MNRRAELAINWLVVAALAILVLFVMGFVFQDQVGRFIEKITNFGDDLDGVRKGEVCASVFTGRICYSSCADAQAFKRTTDPNVQYSIVLPSSDGWNDCKPNEVCCEQVR